MINRAEVSLSAFNPEAELPYELRLKDFEIAMQDVYDFFFDVNSLFHKKGLPRLDDTLRPAMMSGMISDMLTASLAKHSRTLVQNGHFNGHPDLIVQGVYVNDAVKAGSEGVEVKTSKNAGGAVDTHGARNQCMCVFIYRVDSTSEPARTRTPSEFTQVYLANVRVEDFRTNERGALGTRTATLHKEGVHKLRDNWIYKL